MKGLPPSLRAPCISLCLPHSHARVPQRPLPLPPGMRSRCQPCLASFSSPFLYLSLSKCSPHRPRPAGPDIPSGSLTFSSFSLLPILKSPSSPNHSHYIFFHLIAAPKIKVWASPFKHYIIKRPDSILLHPPIRFPFPSVSLSQRRKPVVAAAHRRVPTRVASFAPAGAAASRRRKRSSCPLPSFFFSLFLLWSNCPTACRTAPRWSHRTAPLQSHLSFFPISSSLSHLSFSSLFFHDLIKTSSSGIRACPQFLAAPPLSRFPPTACAPRPTAAAAGTS